MHSVQSPSYQSGMDARFAIAARHSRMVRFLRVAVPVVVGLAMAAIVGVSIFNPFRILTAKLPVDIGNLVVSGTKITMETPHLSGFSPDQRPYEMWAKTATQDLTDPDNLDLNTLRAKVLMEDQSIVTVDARTGLFNTKTQMLDLRKDVFLQTSTGYEVRLDQATVDIANGAVSTDDGVNVKLTNGTIKANKLRLTEKGDVIRFEGNVVMNLVMDSPTVAPESPPSEAAPAPPPPRSQSSKPQSEKSRSSSGNRVSAK